MNNEQLGYADIVEMIKDDIMGNNNITDGKIRSTTVLSRVYEVNPTTAVKAVSKLQAEGYLRKEPGIGMYVVSDAKERIMEDRKKKFEEVEISKFLENAKKLGFSLDNIKTKIEERYPNI